MKNGKHFVIGIGELLWDMLPEGKKMGGAPANFAYHINNAACTGLAISCVGDDANGRELIKSLSVRGLDPGLIQIDGNKPTGTVSVRVDEAGNPSYIIHENVAWDNIRFTSKIRENLLLADAICFGSLAQRSKVSYETIAECLGKVNSNCLKVFDINIRQNFYTSEKIIESLNLSDVLKINEDEIKVVADIFNLGRKDELSILHYLSERFDLRLIALTKGADSSMLYSEGEISVIQTPRVNVVDTVGAGDSFTAVLVAGLLKNDSMKSIHQKAVEVSAWICTVQGATPDYNEQINDILSSYY